MKNLVANLGQTVNITEVTKIFYIFAFDMSSVEKTSTKEISLKFSPMTSVSSADKIYLVEISLATIGEHVQVQNTAAPIMYTSPVSNMTINQQHAEITQITLNLCLQHQRCKKPSTK